MRKLYLLLMGFFLIALTSKSQTIIDGRAWNFAVKMYGDNETLYTYTVRVCGDTIVKGKVCKKLVRTDSESGSNIQKIYTYNVFEEDSKIFETNTTEEPWLRLDYDLHVGDKVSPLLKVESVDSIEIDGIRRKRITLACSESCRDDNYQGYIVEGLGMSTSKYYGEYFTSFYAELISVYDNGKCIFKSDDFSKPSTSVNRLPIRAKEASTLYDLSGRRVLIPQKGSIYIKGNKKVAF